MLKMILKIVIFHFIINLKNITQIFKFLIIFTNYYELINTIIMKL